MGNLVWIFVVYNQFNIAWVVMNVVSLVDLVLQKGDRFSDQRLEDWSIEVQKLLLIATPHVGNEFVCSKALGFFNIGQNLVNFFSSFGTHKFFHWDGNLLGELLNIIFLHEVTHHIIGAHSYEFRVIENCLLLFIEHETQAHDETVNIDYDLVSVFILISVYKHVDSLLR